MFCISPPQPEMITNPLISANKPHDYHFGYFSRYFPIKSLNFQNHLCGCFNILRQFGITNTVKKNIAMRISIGVIAQRQKTCGSTRGIP